MHIGRVTQFHEPRGLGVVVDGDDRTYPFHCIELADGTRTVGAGVDVVFDVIRKFGHLEAVGVVRR